MDRKAYTSAKAGKLIGVMEHRYSLQITYLMRHGLGPGHNPNLIEFTVCPPPPAPCMENKPEVKNEGGKRPRYRRGHTFYCWDCPEPTELR